MSIFICRYCDKGKELNSENFKVERRTRLGFDSVCRLCRCNERNEHRKRNKHAILLKEAEYRKTKQYQKYHYSYWKYNRDVLNEKAKERYYNDPTPYLKRSKEQRLKDPRAYAEYQKQWRSKNKEHTNAYVRNRLHADINFKLRHLLRTKLRKMLNGLNKTNSALKYLGCDISFFRGYLEGKFRDGMTWDNYGKHWHIDHIKPCAAFDFTQEADRATCFHYSNMQPLLAIENLTKGDRISC